MKVLIANNDRTADLGSEIQRSARARRRDRESGFVSSDISALCLLKAASEEQYLCEFIRLLRRRDAFDTLDFDVPRRPGPLGWIMAKFKRLLWKLLRYQHDRIAFKQNLINGMFTNVLELESSLRRQESGELKRRITELEAFVRKDDTPGSGAAPS